MINRLGRCVLGLLFITLAPITSNAQTNQSSSEQWQFEVSPYLFASALDGTVGFNGVTADVDASFSDLFEYVDSAFMGVFEARKGKWGFGIDLVYTKLENQKTFGWSGPGGIGGGDGQLLVTMTQQVYTPMVAYRYMDDKTKLDVIGGARYTQLDTDIDLTLTPVFLPGGARSASTSESWWDPVIGVRVLHPFADKWSFLGYADIGGFGVGSDLTYQVMAGANWYFGKKFNAKMGYRYLYWDYEDNGFIWDMAMHGLYLGLGYKF